MFFVSPSPFYLFVAYRPRFPRPHHSKVKFCIPILGKQKWLADFCLYFSFISWATFSSQTRRKNLLIKFVAKIVWFEPRKLCLSQQKTIGSIDLGTLRVIWVSGDKPEASSRGHYRYRGDGRKSIRKRFTIANLLPTLSRGTKKRGEHLGKKFGISIAALFVVVVGLVNHISHNINYIGPFMKRVDL